MKRGVITRVTTQQSSSPKVEVNINGKPDSAPVTRSVVNYLSEISEDLGFLYTRIDHESLIPVGSGMGSSGAGAWGTALALSHLLSLNLTLDRIGQLAHRAEVENKTGLGTVIAQQRGGIEIRVVPGAPGIGHVDQIPFDPDLRVVCSSAGPISTRSMLSDLTTRARINRFGGELVKRIIDRASPNTFMRLSREFFERTKLPSKNVEVGLKMLDEEGFHDCSMALFGETIFALAWIDETERIVKVLRNWNKSGVTFSTEIDVAGPRIVGCEKND
jgi:pantoate kinase